MEEMSFQEYATVKQGPKFPRKLLVMLLFLLLLAGLGLIGFGFLNSNETNLADIIPTEAPTPTSFPTDTPVPTGGPTEAITITPEVKKATPTLKPTTSTVSGSSVDKTTGLDRAALTIKVLNGSGVAGAAKGISDELSELGYTISSTGNADSFDYKDLTIQVKSANSKYLSLLKKDLSTKYTIGSTSADLSSASGTGAVVIVGK